MRILPSILGFLPAIALLALTSACTGEDHVVGRGSLGKADIVGSCDDDGSNFCAGQSADGCWCDDLCASYGDCCADIDAVCDGSAEQNACEDQGGECVALVQGACSDGVFGDPADCGGGVGVGCCLPAANACEDQGGECVALVPGACSDGVFGDPADCGGGVGVGCCLPAANACESQGGACVPLVPGACDSGAFGDPADCGGGVGVACCLP